MTRITLFTTALLFVAFLAGCDKSPNTQTSIPAKGNNFQTLLGKNESEVQAKIDAAWNHPFYGDNDRERIYYEASDDMAYIMDITSEDIRIEAWA